MSHCEDSPVRLLVGAPDPSYQWGQRLTLESDCLVLSCVSIRFCVCVGFSTSCSTGEAVLTQIPTILSCSSVSQDVRKGQMGISMSQFLFTAYWFLQTHTLRPQPQLTDALIGPSAE
ncbi:hypothetical protein GOODEAATRI_022170 [Goodea atripinnis]|uniref:Uncharacterized protein n=1 Tax=Goodea atripinnis TaxID=208336 RepID=A0ABV0P6Y4_9TELE